MLLLYTTQRIKVEGKGYLMFVNQFFQPFLYDKIKSVTPDKIERYNKDVIAEEEVIVHNESLKATKTYFKCDQCEYSTINEEELPVHKVSKHNLDTIKKKRNPESFDSLE